MSDVFIAPDTVCELDSVKIFGNIESQKASSIDFQDSIIFGKIILKDTEGYLTLNHNTISKKLQIQNTVEDVRVTENVINGTLLIADTREYVAVEGNVIGGNFKCNEEPNVTIERENNIVMGKDKCIIS